MRRRGRPISDPDRNLRLDILTASRDLLNEGGPGALSMREVARRTGCTHQAPYHYFEDRESILAALVCEGFHALARDLNLANSLIASKSVRAVLMASAQAYVNFAVRHPGVFRVMFRPDMCNPTRFPEVMEAGMRARAELDHLNRIVYGEAARPATATILWSHVHGLSCLLLDGPLTVSCQPECEHSTLLRDVAEAFADLVLEARSSAPDVSAPGSPSGEACGADGTRA